MSTIPLDAEPKGELPAATVGDQPPLRSLPLIAPSVLEMVRTVTGLETAFIAEARPETDTQRIVHSRSSGGIDLSEGSSLSWADSVCKHAADSGMWSTDDVEHDLPGTHAAELGIRTYVGAPIRDSDSRLIATLCGVSTGQHPIDPHTQSVIVMLAQLVGDQWSRDRIHNAELKYLGGLEQQAREHTIVLAEAEHKLKTPLAIITGWAETLLSDNRLTAQPVLLKALTGIRDASHRASEQVNLLLEDARGRALAGALASQQVNLSNLVRTVAEDLMKVCSSDHRIICNVDRETQGYGDEDAINQVIWHLAENAVKYSPSGGTITFTLDEVTVDQTEPSDQNESTAEPKSQVRLLITDEGIGLPADQIDDESFTPFTRGSNTGDISGTGLGLHIVRRLVLAMNGTISLRRRDDVGTCAELTLPGQPPT